MVPSELLISYRLAPGQGLVGGSKAIQKPTLDQVTAALDELGAGSALSVSLTVHDSDAGMIVIGENGRYHVAIATDLENFYYWNGQEPSEERVALGGHEYPAHMITSDLDAVRRVVVEFCRRGLPLEGEKWIHEEDE